MYDELGEGQVEGRLVEGQLLGNRRTDVDRWEAGAQAATNDADGSTAATASAPSRRTSSAVSAPGPAPTSSAR